MRYWIRKAVAECAPNSDRRVEDEELDRLRMQNAQLSRAIELLKTANCVLSEQLDPTRLRT